MGGDTTSTTSSSSLNNPQLNKAVSTIGSQLNTQLGKGYKGYSGSLVPEMSSETQAGLGALSSNPNNSIFSQGVSGALGQQSQIAQGNFGADPARARLIDDTTTAVNAAFQGSGRFGAETNKNALGDKLIGTLGAYDNARQQQAIQSLPGLYSASNMPAAGQLQAGQTMDAYNASKAQEAARQFDVNNNAGWLTLQQGGSILGTTAPSAGMTTTNTQPATPWWQGLLSAGLGAF